MRVFLADDEGFPRLVGHADVPPDHPDPVLTVTLFGAVSTMVEHFLLGFLERVPPGAETAEGPSAAPERVVLLAPGQLWELLPGWAPLAA